jgi:hypothetical protein
MLCGVVYRDETGQNTMQDATQNFSQITNLHSIEKIEKKCKQMLCVAQNMGDICFDKGRDEKKRRRGHVLRK